MSASLPRMVRSRRGHLGRGFDSGEAASRHDDGVAGLRRRLLRQRMEVVVELDGFIHQVDAECVLRKARNVGAEAGAAGSQDQSVVGQRLKLAFGPDEARQAGRAVDRLDRPLHVADIDLAEELRERRLHRLRFGFVQPRPDHEEGLGRDQRDLKIVGGYALQVAEAGGGYCGIHSSKPGADDEKSLHGKTSSCWCFDRDVSASDRAERLCSGLVIVLDLPWFSVQAAAIGPTCHAMIAVLSMVWLD